MVNLFLTMDIKRYLNIYYINQNYISELQSMKDKIDSNKIILATKNKNTKIHYTFKRKIQLHNIDGCT